MAVAAPREAEAIVRGAGAPPGTAAHEWTRLDLNDRLALVLTGVGKSNAAGALARTVSAQDAGVLSIGLSGALPGSGLDPGDVLLADTCVLADEGVETFERFLPQSDLGFPALAPFGERFPTAARWNAALAGLADRVGPAATISTCAGTDHRAEEIARRTGALAEDMESAAAALVARRLSVPFACLRVVSNRTGTRERQGWDLPRAFAALERIASAL
jgi:futalosine hydrolase